MAKDKKKKKKPSDADIDALKTEYDEGLEMIKAKNEQLDGMIREVKIYMETLRKEIEEFRSITKPLDNE